VSRSTLIRVGIGVGALSVLVAILFGTGVMSIDDHTGEDDEPIIDGEGGEEQIDAPPRGGVTPR